MKENGKQLNLFVSLLAAWAGLMFVLDAFAGVRWFDLGDFDYRTAMAYHGLLVSAWMMLALAYVRRLSFSNTMIKSLGTSAVIAAVLAGFGSLLIREQGFSLGTSVQVAGMILAEITALVIIVEGFFCFFEKKEKEINPLVFWTVSVALIGLSLATPLGHLAGAAQDLGDKFPSLTNFFGLKSDEAISGFVGSHSHQILAAFLAAGFTLPLMYEPFSGRKAIRALEKSGLLIIIAATIVQVLLYQFSAWFGWEPPDLFANDPNGMPLDDFVLSALGVGMALLLPALLEKNRVKPETENRESVIRLAAAVSVSTYIISIVALGVFIEFNEQFFGHGEAGAPGFLNDLSYIRAHMIFGFLIIPLSLAALLHFDLLKINKMRNWLAGLFFFIIAAGFVGIFVWTFFLNFLILKISFVLTPVFLLLFSYLLARKEKMISSE